MASEQNILKQGYLHKWKIEADNSKAGWQPMYFVLHGPSSRNAARLDWYDGEDQFHKNPGKRKALFVEEIKKCEHIPLTAETKKMYNSSAKYLLMIHTYRPNITNYVLKCGSEELMREWLDHLTKLLKDVHTLSKAMRTAILEKPFDQDDIYNPKLYAASYDVEVDDTAAAIHCELHGMYRLLLSQQHITLTDPDTSNPVITWMYRHIRRFGYSERSLTIEGGSKCGIGQGLFIFKTDRGNQLMDAINERMKLCRSQPEGDYSYVSFGKTDEKTSEQTKAAADKKNSQMKSPPMKALSSNATTKPNEHLHTPDPHPQQQQQPKMSEVLMQMPSQNVKPKVVEDDVYGYNHLDLKMMTPIKSNAATTEEDENPYGEQLIQQIKKSK